MSWPRLSLLLLDTINFVHVFANLSKNSAGDFTITKVKRHFEHNNFFKLDK